MKTLKKSDFNKALPYIFASVFILAAMLVIYAIHSIFPFGNGTVAGDDMVQQTIPAFTHFWDCLHNGDGASLLWSWNTGGGIGTLTFGFYILRPVYILFTLLCPRDGITDGMSFLVIIMMILSAISLIYFLRRNFKALPVYWQVAFGVLYAMSAYVMQYYTQLGWFDMIVMLPLICDGAIEMFNTGKWWKYVLAVAYTTAGNIYMSFMLYIFLFLVGGLYIIFMLNKELKGRAVIRFGLSTVGGLLLSASITLPTVFILTNTSRFETAEAKVNTFKSIFGRGIASAGDQNVMIAILFAQTAVMWAFLLLGIVFTRKKDLKKTLFFVLSVLTVSLPAVFEGINLLWHKLSYRMFPMRFGYMVSFMLICAAAYAYGLVKDKKPIGGGIASIALTVAATFAGVCGIVAFYRSALVHYDSLIGMKYNDIYPNQIMTIAVCALLIVSYGINLLVSNKKIAYGIMAAFMCCEAALAANSAFGLNASNKGVSASYSLDYIKEATEMHENVTVEYDAFARFKDCNSAMNNNYPIILGYPALSNFTHSASGDLTGAMSKLGYSQVYTRIVDNGGTLFTDALLGLKYTITRNELSDEICDLVQNTAGFNLYSNKYYFGSGVLVNKNFGKIEDLNRGDPYVTNEELAKEIYGCEDIELFDNIENYKIEADEPELSVDIKVEGAKQLYLLIRNSKKASTYIMVNDELMDFGFFSAEDNTYLFHNNYNNGLINLGTFKDETVNVTISSDIDKGKSITAQFAQLDLEELGALCAIEQNNASELETGNRSLKTNVTAPVGNLKLFIPVCYDEGWSCKVNGKKVEIEEAMGSFMNIPLVRGENEIEMIFTPKGLTAGIIISIAALLIGIVILIIQKKKLAPKPDKSNKFLDVISYVYTAVVALAFTGAYIIPIFYSLYTTITK